MILSSHARVGSISRRTPWKNCICVRHCPHCHRRSVLWFGPREDHSHRDRSCVARLRDSPSSRPSLSVCCSSVVSTCPSLVLPQLPAGVLGRRGFAVQSAIARICREGGARVSTNLFVRDLDLGAFNLFDGRRLEVVANGLSLFGGAQLAIDTTLVSTLRRDGTAREGASQSQWRCHQVRTPTKGEDLPSTCVCRGSCSVGHPCWRGRRALVARDCELLAGSGSCEGSGRFQHFASQRRLVPPLVTSSQRPLSLILCWKAREETLLLPMTLCGFCRFSVQLAESQRARERETHFTLPPLP